MSEEFTARVGQLSANKRELLELLRRRAAAGQPVSIPPPAARPAVLDDDERARVLALARGPEREFRRASLARLVAETARRHPDAVAVVAEDGEASYAELDRLSTALAHRLGDLGVGPGASVAIALDRGLDAIVAVLGTVKAGAAYVAIDPGRPAVLDGHDATAVLDGHDATAVLTHSEHLGGLRLDAGPRTVCLDKERPTDLPTVDAELTPVDPTSTVALVHPTGGNDGVRVTHEMVCAHLDWLIETHGFGPGCRVLHASPLPLDDAIVEIFTALVSGATLIIGSRDDARTPDALTGLVRNARVTHLFATPAMLTLVAPGEYPHLRVVVFSGEVCTAELVRAWRRPGRQLSNVYGRAGAGLACVGLDCSDWAADTDPPLGRPLPNRRVYLLDETRTPVPAGVRGEIVVDDPLTPGGQPYRTGTRAFWTEDDQIQLASRIGQVRPAGSRTILAANPSTIRTGPVRRPSRPCLVPLQEQGDRPRLILVHPVSGSPYWYSNMIRLLPTDRPVDGFEAPGLEGDVPPMEGMIELAAHFVAELRQRQPEGPYLLAGWSMGGFVVFEMGRQLIAAGAEVALTAMLDADAPGPYPEPTELDIMQRFATEMAAATGRPVPDIDPRLAELGPDERLAAVVTRLAEAGIITDDILPEFMRNRYAVFRANVRSLYLYQPLPHPGRIALISARESVDTAPIWRKYASGEVDLVKVPGDHYTMWSKENLPPLIEALRGCVERALPR